MFLIWRVLDRRQVRARVETFVASLENRTPEELAERARSLKSHPKVAKHILPEIARTIRSSRSESRQWAAIEISRAFLDDESIVNRLYALRTDQRESIAAAAVHVLAELTPPDRAARMLGECLVDAEAAAARDEACAGLYAIGEPGRAEMARRIQSLSESRRVWLVKYVAEHPSPVQAAWLDLLNRDASPRVRSAVAAALGRDAEAVESVPADRTSDPPSSQREATAVDRPA